MSTSPGAPDAPGPGAADAAPQSDSIARNTSFALVVSLVSAVFTAVLTIFLLRVLGPREYGVFSLAMGVGALVLIPANLGIPHAAARYLADSRKHRPTAHGVISDAVRLKVAVSAVCCLALIALAEPIANAYDAPELTWPIRIMAFAVAGQSMLQLYDQLFEAEGRISVYLRVVTFESAIETVASIGLVLAGLGVSGAMAGRAGAYLFAAGFGFVLLVRTLGTRPRLRGRGHGNVRRIATYGSALLIIDGAFALFNQIDVLLIGAILSITAVGEFQAPMRLVTFLGYAGAAVASGVSPRVAAGHEGPDSKAFDRALRRLMAFQGIFVAPLVIWAEPITELVLGSEYLESASVLRAITPFVFLIAISPLLSRTVTYLGEAWMRIPIAIGALAINFVFDLIFLSKIGIVAGAWGTDIAYAIYVGAHLLIVRRLLGTPLRPLALGFMRVMVAAAAMAGVLFLLGGTSDVPLPLLAVGAVIGPIVYVAALLATRELTTAELAAARGFVAARLPRRG
jgi:O-antigen/teichoic acid export membrane protein